jgi:hypothetical protein
METPVQTKSRDNSGIMIASVAAFIILSLGAVIFLYNQNQALKSELAKYQTATVSPTPIATVVEKTASPSASPKSAKATPRSPTILTSPSSTSSGVPIVY